MKTLTLLIITICFSSAFGQSQKPLTPEEHKRMEEQVKEILDRHFPPIPAKPKPLSPEEQSTQILQAQIERLERKLDAMKKIDDALMEQERAARNAGATTRDSRSYLDYFPEYPSYRYYPRTYLRYYQRSYYPRYYPRYYFPRLRFRYW